MLVIKTSGRATRNAKRMFRIPNDFGVLSPKIITKSIITTVAMPIPILPKIIVAIVPAIIEARILTRLFPMTIALITFSGFLKADPT